MGYTSGPGGVLRKKLEAGREGVNQKQTHAFFVTDIEFFVLEAYVRAKLHRTPETDVLAGRVLRVGLDWEHLEALLSDDPAERDPEDVDTQARLAEETEILAGEVDVRTGVVDRQGRPFPPIREDQGSDR